MMEAEVEASGAQAKEAVQASSFWERQETYYPLELAGEVQSS